ncbi:MAG: hypothetical protein M5R38_08360 [Candidatus Methylomirabilis sp.]|nr:hypothetical protein [Candidatus Methylomirabilis sp.]
MSETRQAIDWQEIYSRLAQTRRHLETSERRSLDEVERILRDRAFVLAQPLPEVQSPREPRHAGLRYCARAVRN